MIALPAQSMVVALIGASSVEGSSTMTLFTLTWRIIMVGTMAMRMQAGIPKWSNIGALSFVLRVSL